VLVVVGHRPARVAVLGHQGVEVNQCAHQVWLGVCDGTDDAAAVAVPDEDRVTPLRCTGLDRYGAQRPDELSDVVVESNHLVWRFGFRVQS
jgi:hypothetical protein